MGHNTTVVVMNDALDQIENDPMFGKKLSRAIAEVSLGKRVNVSAGYMYNAATVIETHHADGNAVISVGGNSGMVLGYTFTNDREKQLKELAAEMGYRLVKKSKK